MKTLVIGASPNPERFSYKAVRLLKRYGHEVIPAGIRDGEIAGLPIIKGKPEVKDVHTVTLYVGPARQAEYYDYVLGLKPRRLIFNPGTENPEFMRKAEEHGIKTVVNCTLVMLNGGLF
ncbi:MAG: CoA-binding protein [Chlorobi bacterium]|nr:CoA-binding protein [Chlorobiota bacterium]